MGFGGAFAPNRFESISTLVAAWAQRRQASFDAAQPPPRAAQGGAAERAACQRRGVLGGGPEQLEPRFLQ
eukprot:5128774-Pleurochrysis_carterae.AAC.1